MNITDFVMEVGQLINAVTHRSMLGAVVDFLLLRRDVLLDLFVFMGAFCFLSG